MFSYFKKRRAILEARETIGVELHRQIWAAMNRSELKTSERLSTAFIPGYVYWFVRMGFSSQGMDGGSLVDKHLPIVCDGVIPLKLHTIFQSQLAALEVAHEIKDQFNPIRGTTTSPARLKALFEKGVEMGVLDGSSLSSRPDNLRKYLMCEQLP